MTRSVRGFTLVEVLIALAVIGVAFGALALTQVTNLRASVTAQTATETKAAANLVLEAILAEVLTTRDVSAGEFDFAYYYWNCPSSVEPPSGTVIVSPSEPLPCQGDRTINVGERSEVDVEYAIVGESGILGEGVLTITVTATHEASRQRLTIGDRVTCYDVYPSPTSTAPEPCPLPTASGGGRPLGARHVPPDSGSR